MIRSHSILFVIALVFLAGTAHAQSVHWKYVQAGWGSVDPDRGTREDGLLVGGAFDLTKVPIHIFGEFNDLGRNDVWQLGGGWHGLLGQRADLFADGAFYDADVDDGFRVRFGVRWMLNPRLELNGYLSWTELDFSDNKSASVNAVFDFTNRFAIGGGFEWGDNFNSARVFGRFNFGQRG
jgi:hypothetical protein